MTVPEPAQTLRRQIDAYAAGDPTDGDCGPTFERKDVAAEAIAALHAVLDVCDTAFVLNADVSVVSVRRIQDAIRGALS